MKLIPSLITRERSEGCFSHSVNHVAGAGFPWRAALGCGVPRRPDSCRALPVTQQEPIALQEGPRGGAGEGETGSTPYAPLFSSFPFWLCVNNVESVLNQVSKIIVSALNQNLVEFELKPGVRVIVYNTQLTLGKRLFGRPWSGKVHIWSTMFHCMCNGIISACHLAWSCFAFYMPSLGEQALTKPSRQQRPFMYRRGCWTPSRKVLRNVFKKWCVWTPMSAKGIRDENASPDNRWHVSEFTVSV